MLLVLVDGRTVFADAAPGFSVDAPHLLASGTKSFAGTAAMLAVADGLLTLDEPVSATIDEWRGEPRKARATIRDLLTLSAGLEALSDLGSAAGARAAGVRNRAEAAIAARSVAAPGERFIYGPSSFYVFGELFKRKLARSGADDADLVAYLERRLFQPLGIEPGFFRDDAGNPNMAGGCRISATDWARFGEFVRRRGAIDGMTLLEPELVEELARTSGPNPRYGLTWWLIPSDGTDGGEATEEALGRSGATEGDETAADGAPLGIVAAGKGKQKLYVLPGHGMTVVRFGEVNGSRRFRDEEFLGILLGGE